MDTFVSTGDLLQKFVFDCGPYGRESWSTLALELHKSPELYNTLNTGLVNSDLPLIDPDFKAGKLCLVMRLQGIDNYAVKVELKIPGMDYNKPMLDEVLPFLTILYEDDKMQITTIPYISRFLSEDLTRQDALLIYQLVNSLYAKGWLFWDCKPDNIGIIQDVNGNEKAAIIDPNSIVRLENQDVLLHVDEDDDPHAFRTFKAWFDRRISEVIWELCPRKHSYPLDFIIPDFDCRHPNTKIQVDLLEQQFPRGFDITSRLPNDKAIITR